VLQEAITRRKEQWRIDHDQLRLHDLSKEELDLFESLRARRVFAGDMYEIISEIEVRTHTGVRKMLETQFGPEERGWWFQGIPVEIRKKCASSREVDDEPTDDRFSYTNFIHLSSIIDKHSGIFDKAFPVPMFKDKKKLKSDFSRLNGIRNAVMHPVKGRKWNEEDFEFVRDFLGRLPF